MMKYVAIPLVATVLLCSCGPEEYTQGTATTAEAPAPRPDNKPPEAGAVVPAAGSGTVQEFQVAWTDPDGASDIQWVQLLVNDALEGEGACYAQWERGMDATFLQNDKADGLIGPVYPSKPGTIENGQCVLDPAAMRVQFEDQRLTITFPLRFKPSFQGPKKVFIRTQDDGGHLIQWEEKGAWEVK